MKYSDFVDLLSKETYPGTYVIKDGRRSSTAGAGMPVGDG